MLRKKVTNKQRVVSILRHHSVVCRIVFLLCHVSAVLSLCCVFSFTRYLVILFNYLLLPERRLCPFFSWSTTIISRTMDFYKRQRPAFCLLPSVYCLLLTAFCSLPSAHCAPRTAYCAAAHLFAMYYKCCAICNNIFKPLNCIVFGLQNGNYFGNCIILWPIQL